MSLFKPAVILMNRLKYPQKFGLISFVLLLPLVFLIYSLFSELQNRIDFSQKEVLGNQYLRPIDQLLEHALQYRILHERFQNSTAELGRLEKQITIDVKALNQIDRSLGNDLKTNAQLASLNQTWQTIVSGQRNWSLETKRTFHERLLGDIDRLRSQVGDQSNLILDPDLDTYYLMDATLLSLPEMQNNLADIQAISWAASSRGKLTSSERSQLIILKGTLRIMNDEMQRKFQVSFNNNPTGNLRPKLTPSIENLSRNIEILINQLEQINYDSSPRLYIAPADRSLKQSFKLWDETIDQLDYLLHRRVNGFAQNRFWIALFVLLILAIAAYLFVGFYRGMMQVVSRLSAASKRMIVGNLHESVQLDSRDELAEVVRSFNDVADALRSAEANYRGIFENALEGIFQTTLDGHYLAANPALAKMYGYDSPSELTAALTNISRQLYVDPQRRDQFAQAMQINGRVQGFESQIYRKDGSIIWISESARVVYDGQGKPLKYEGTVEDISQRKQAEKEIAELTQRLQSENLRMSAELEVTRQLQQMLLPTELELGAVNGLEIAGFMEPADEVGGDYYDVLQQDGKVRISIGDVTGHGLESGVVMIMAQTAVRTLLVNGETDPAKFLNAVNRIIYENTRRMRSRKNMTLALLEYEAGTLRLSGQHEELIIVRANGQIESIDTLDLGFPLGLESDISPFVAQVNVQLQSQDLAVLYTDGITEAMNASNQQYGLERMCQVVKQNRDRSVTEIRQTLIEDLMHHIGEQKVFDDITLLVLRQR